MRVPVPNDVTDEGIKIESMRALMEVIIWALVDSQGEAFVNAIPGVAGTVLVIRSAHDDVGKIIGKQGRTARSLRTVLSAASVKMGLRFSLEVQEQA